MNEQEAFRPDGNDPDDDQSEFDLTGEFKIDFAAPAWYASNDTSGGGASAGASSAAPPASSPATPTAGAQPPSDSPWVSRSPGPRRPRRRDSRRCAPRKRAMTPRSPPLPRTRR